MNEETNKKITHNISFSPNKSKGDTKSNSPNIHSAAANGDIEKIQDFIDKGISVNSLSGGDWTPLHDAVVRNQKKAAAFLINKGANVYAKDANGKTPLDIAKERNFKDLIEIFKQSSVSTETQYSDSSTTRQSLESNNDNSASVPEGDCSSGSSIVNSSKRSKSSSQWAAMLVGVAIGAPSGLFMGYSLYQNWKYDEPQYLIIWAFVNVIIVNVLLKSSFLTFLVATIMTLIFGIIGFKMN
jgi:ankyrin repeat protein